MLPFIHVVNGESIVFSLKYSDELISFVQKS